LETIFVSPGIGEKMQIDIFCHIAPPKYLKALEEKVSAEVAKEFPSTGLPTLKDLDTRFRVMDHYPDMRQVLTVTNPPVEAIFERQDAVALSQRVNDELAIEVFGG
jgi:aminocarboxymuconate-semialdehyde decarboxylase